MDQPQGGAPPVLSWFILPFTTDLLINMVIGLINKLSYHKSAINLVNPYFPMVSYRFP